MKRNEHTFQFTGHKISTAATEEYNYHLDRVAWWKNEQDAMILKAKAAGGNITVSEYQFTGGKGVNVSTDEIDKIRARLHECAQKITLHQKAADDFQIQAGCYGTQAQRVYKLHPDDVIYFRLAGGPRVE